MKVTVDLSGLDEFVEEVDDYATELMKEAAQRAVYMQHATYLFAWWSNCDMGFYKRLHHKTNEGYPWTTQFALAYNHFL